VLFLGAHAASVDVVLERLAGRSEILALRFLDAYEKIESLPAVRRGFTMEDQKQSFVDRTLTGARRSRDAAESACRQRREQEPLWEELADKLREHENHLLDQAQLAKQEQSLHDSLRPLVEFEGAALGHDLSLLKNQCDNEIEVINADIRIKLDAVAKNEAEAATVAQRIEQSSSAYEAKKHKRFWTPAFWANLFNGTLIAQTEECLNQQARLHAEKVHLTQEAMAAEQRRRERLEAWRVAKDQRITVEIEAQRESLRQDQELKACLLSHTEARWNQLCQELGVQGIAKTAEAMAEAKQGWLLQQQRNEEQCQFAHQWVKFIEDAAPRIAAQLHNYANVLSGTIQRFHADVKFRDAAAVPVDLVIVEDADALVETDLLQLARLGRRCVFIGQSLTEPAPQAMETSQRLPTASPVWPRLWSALGGNANRWPATWQCEEGQLLCQLIMLSADDHSHLESEGLADAPDIELRILHRPGAKPCLAQVKFGPNCAFADAFRFMMREVQEFPLQPLGRTASWSEDERRVYRHFGPCSARIGAWVEVEPGIRLGAAVESDGPARRIARIEFDKCANWTRARADGWLQQQRPAHDSERTVFLQTPHRYQHALVPTVLHAGEWLCTTDAEGDAARHFEFIAVPSLQHVDWPQEGAGLELDLSAARHADRLPTGLRHGLPARGFVNYLEAQAVIRRLESYLQKEVNGHPIRVAVTALYEGQVELLRRLAAQSETLRSCRVPLEIAAPGKLHQREFDVVFLSLTRSHGQRAVAYGADSRELPLALTRASSRLIVFGDPGALTKRVNTNDTIDHLDAAAARQERVHLTRLLTFLRRHATHANGKA
jgi:hypothetical protein